MGSELIVVVAIGAIVVAALWVIGGRLDRWSAGRRSVNYAEFDRLLRQRPEAANAFLTFDAAAKDILRQMGAGEIILRFAP